MDDSRREPGFTPVRTGSTRSNRWIVNSIKEGRPAYFESDLEFLHWIHVELDPCIERFCEQPTEAGLWVNGKLRRSIPDMWVRFRDGSEEFREIKYRDQLGTPRVREQISIQQEWCALHGYNHCVVTEHDLDAGRHFARNANLLVQAVSCRQREGDLLAPAIYSLLERSGAESCKSLASTFSAPTLEELLSGLGTLVLQGLAKVSLGDAPLNWSTPFAVTEGH